MEVIRSSHNRKSVCISIIKISAGDSIARKFNHRQQDGQHVVAARGVVNQYRYQQSEDLRVLEFDEMNEDWLDFIAACRSGQPHDYDVVEGPMADDTVFNYVQSFLDGEISRAAFWELVRFKHPTHQICFSYRAGTQMSAF